MRSFVVRSPDGQLQRMTLPELIIPDGYTYLPDGDQLFYEAQRAARAAAEKAERDRNVIRAQAEAEKAYKRQELYRLLEEKLGLDAAFIEDALN